MLFLLILALALLDVVLFEIGLRCLHRYILVEHKRYLDSSEDIFIPLIELPLFMLGMFCLLLGTPMLIIGFWLWFYIYSSRYKRQSTYTRFT